MNKLLVFGALVGGTALVSSCVHRSSGTPLVVNVKRDGEGCLVTVNGERVTSERLLAIGRAAQKDKAIVLYDKNTPFKCIGGAIFTLQRAGLLAVDSAMWDG